MLICKLNCLSRKRQVDLLRDLLSEFIILINKEYVMLAIAINRLYTIRIVFYVMILYCLRRAILDFCPNETFAKEIIVLSVLYCVH